MRQLAKTRAFGLIEVLIVTVILSIALLNIALLQQKSIQLARDAENYSIAAMLAEDMANRLQANYPEALNNSGGQYLLSHASINSTYTQFAAKNPSDPAADNSATLNAALAGALAACYSDTAGSPICLMGQGIKGYQSNGICGSTWGTLAQAKTSCLANSSCNAVVFNLSSQYDERCGAPIADSNSNYQAWAKNCSRCPPYYLATIDLFDWKAQIQSSLPNGYGIICFDSNPANVNSLTCDNVNILPWPAVNTTSIANTLLTIKISWTSTSGSTAIFTSKAVVASKVTNFK